MARRSIRSARAHIAIGVAILTVMCAPAVAQWVKVPAAAIPRTPDGKPNVSAPAPRLPDGKPDLSGTWQPNGAGKYSTNLAADLKADDVPFQPWARALYDERKGGAHAREDPPANCLPPGVPRIDAAPLPWKIVQTPRFMAIIYEDMNLWRQIFLDARELEPLDRIPSSWLGYSTATWDGDTLVVDSRGFNGKAWLDQLGKPSTDALHVIERFRRTDFGHMDIQITIDDPKAYTRPWTVTEEVRLLTDSEPLEFICNENNRDVEFLPGNK